jgi:hypothetical protein
LEQHHISGRLAFASSFDAWLLRWVGLRIASAVNSQTCDLMPMTVALTAEFLKSTRASGLLQVSRVIPEIFCVKACAQDLLVLICRALTVVQTDDSRPKKHCMDALM